MDYKSQTYSIASYIGFLLFLVLISLTAKAQKYDAVYSGVPWYDDQGKIVSAHGANIIQENGIYYLFGEAHSDTSNAFEGFNCYSSKDLYNWEFKSIALPKQANGKLGPNRVGERPKVMKCPTTGEFILYMHVDSTNYKNQFVGYATSKKITGPYTFKGPLLLDGHPIKKWDMGTFQDLNGKGYILLHGGDIYELNSNYTSIKCRINKAMTSGFESPTLFRKDSLYYFMGSNLTSWEKNDNYYFTATTLAGPWKRQGLFAPKGTLTWNSQSTFVIPIYGSKDTSFIYMGDRWSYPKQASAATYIWQPLTIKADSISIPAFHEAWEVDLATGIIKDLNKPNNVVRCNDPAIQYNGNWQFISNTEIMKSTQKGDNLQFTFKGRQIALYSLADSASGYANVKIQDKSGNIIYSAIVDMYCLYPNKGLKFISPILPKGQYKLVLTVMGEHPSWSDKRKSDYGSKGNYVSIDKITVFK